MGSRRWLIWLGSAIVACALPYLVHDTIWFFSGWVLMYPLFRAVCDLMGMAGSGIWGDLDIE